MGIYVFRNPKTKETKEITQKMNDPHIYVDNNGLKWERIFINPNTSVDTTINPFSESDFMRKTAKKKGNLGELWDLSKELSQKRATIHGKDPIKEKAVSSYRKKTKKPHPHE